MKLTVKEERVERGLCRKETVISRMVHFSIIECMGSVGCLTHIIYSAVFDWGAKNFGEVRQGGWFGRLTIIER